MAKGFLAEIESQIQSTRARMQFARIDGIELAEVNSRLAQLGRSLQEVGPKGDSELFRHFPVAAVAVLESHFKTTVAAIIDAGSPYLERGLSLAKDRLKSAGDVVPLLHRKSVTIGEMVAHVIPINSVSSLETALRALFETDIKDLIATARDPYRRRSNDAVPTDPLVASVEDLWRELAAAFDRRHILAHEAATKFELSFDDAKAAIDACGALINALDAVMWSTIWKDVPLTQYEMNVEACLRYKAERKAVTAKIHAALAVATANDERARFRQLHAQWKAFSKQWFAWEAEALAMGSIRPMLAAASREQAMRARREALQGWLSLMCPLGPVSGK